MNRPVAIVPPVEAQWFDRLVSALTARGYQPGEGETPREFAAGATAYLRAHSATAAVADVPLEWADEYYRTRYGGFTTPDARRDELEAGLDALKRTLPTDMGFKR
jgi:hypothetical protein